GVSGFIGSQLSRKLAAANHSVLPVSRNASSTYNWSDASLSEEVQKADAVIHLAGENLFAKRWTDQQKEILSSSRMHSTKKVAALVAARKPSCFICASTVGYYGPNDTNQLRESSPHGNDFLTRLCVDWENATSSATAEEVRTAVVRNGVV